MIQQTLALLKAENVLMGHLNLSTVNLQPIHCHFVSNGEPDNNPNSLRVHQLTYNFLSICLVLSCNV